MTLPSSNGVRHVTGAAAAKAAWCLALGASGVSLAVSVLVGWQRGGVLAEQCLFAAIGIVVVFGAHLILAICRAFSVGIWTWMLGVVLWLACLAYAATSHADFFIEAQARRGEHRIAAMESQLPPTAPMPKRTLSSILEEVAAVRAKWMQARLSEATCNVDCGTRKIRQVILQSRIAALDAEEEEARRWQVAADQLQRRREALRDDPVTARLARDYGVTREVAGAVTVLPVVVILEGLGALGWYLVLLGRRRTVTAVTSPAIAVEVTSRGMQAAGGDADMSPVTAPVAPVVTALGTSAAQNLTAAVVSHDDATKQSQVQTLAAKVWIEVQQGRVKSTVSGIRNHLRIGQAQARAVAQVIRRRQADEEIASRFQ